MSGTSRGTFGTPVSLDGRFWVSGRHEGRAGLLRGDGRTWRWCRPLPDAAARTPDGVHGTPGGEVWVFSDIIARWDGATWISERGPEAPTACPPEAVARLPGNGWRLLVGGHDLLLRACL
ncbi:hypothetical protein ACFVYR_26030 [Streptomyces sp. NPDC058284]|uniref:hypothetical protein n=1 Tax=unclassified Streptomyces TaxID=2593676 RepID=UPI003649163B